MSTIKIYEDIERERDRIQSCINKYGWTSDHNLDWFIDAVKDESYKPMFIELNDGSGLLTHKSKDEWRMWSDPLSRPGDAAERIYEFSKLAPEEVKEVWCDDVSETIYPELQKKDLIKLNKIYYSLFWPVLNMSKYDTSLPGGHFKEIRNARNKFYRDHKIQVVSAAEVNKSILHNIVDNWEDVVLKKQKEDVYELKYHKAIDNNFRGFKTARVLTVDGDPVGFNAGYEVPNISGRFAGVIGIHSYSLKDLGIILWLEDLDWIKSNGYRELDMQGDEEGGGLKLKLSFGSQIERKTNTFSIVRK